MAKSNSKLWYIIAIGALFLLSGYLWNSNNQLKKQIVAQQSEFAELETVQAELDADYQKALESIESLRDDNQELNNLIDNQKAELTEQKKKIDRLIRTRRDLDKAKEEIANLNLLASQYVGQLNDLKEENARLASANVKLSEEKDVLTSDLQQTIAVAEELTLVKTDLEAKNQSLQGTNQNLAATVDLGSAIKVNSLDVSGFMLKGDNKLKGRKRASKVDVLRTCLVTEANLISQPGDEQFYIRIIDPIGETIAVSESGSGVMKLKQTGDEIKYTTVGKINYKNNASNACFDYQLNYELGKGQYLVEVYNKGYKVGQSNFTLK